MVSLMDGAPSGAPPQLRGELQIPDPGFSKNASFRDIRIAQAHRIHKRPVDD
jgi:hypothetical protein